MFFTEHTDKYLKGFFNFNNMAQGKKSFIAYSDWKDTFDAIPDEQAGKLIKHIFSYVNDENPKTDDILVNAVFQSIKNSLKRDLKKWDKQYEQRVEAGKRSAEVRKRNSTLVNARSISSTVSDSVSVTGSVNGSVKKDISIRKAEFKNSLQPFLDIFGKDLLNEFFLYWTEKKPKGRKMLFEMQKTWDVKLRLDRWKKKDFGNKKQEKPKREDAAIILQKKYGLI